VKITIDLNINASELANALKALGEALAGAGLAPALQTATAPQQLAEAPSPVELPAAPLATPVPAAVPITTQAYTTDQLAVAATTIIDGGRRQEVVALLAQFGAKSLMALPKEQYGAFATQLRALGAKL